MAKKTVATLGGKSSKFTKVMKMVKSPKTGAYGICRESTAYRPCRSVVKRQLRIYIFWLLGLLLVGSSPFFWKTVWKQVQIKKVYKKVLKRPRGGFISKIQRFVLGKSKVNENFLDNLEETLISGDVGINTTLKIIGRVEARVSKDKYLNEKELFQILREEITTLLPEDKSLF